MLGHTHEESNDAIASYISSVCWPMHHMDVIDVIVSCMIPAVNVICSKR